MSERSWARQGLDLLLARYPDADITLVTPYSGSVWWQADLTVGRFAIWVETGAVYRVNELGACHDDPFLVPEGSPCGDGPVEPICRVSACDRDDLATYEILTGGEKVELIMCGPHSAEYRLSEVRRNGS